MESGDALADRFSRERPIPDAVVVLNQVTISIQSTYMQVSCDWFEWTTGNEIGQKCSDVYLQIEGLDAVNFAQPVQIEHWAVMQRQPVLRTRR